MKNITIKATSHNTYVVIADTARFGKEAIMFESYKQSECIKYIIRTLSLIYKVTKKPEVVGEILNWMSEKKQLLLHKACYRNNCCTSEYGQSYCYTWQNEKGLYIMTTGTRSSFTVFFDTDGTERKAPPVKTLGQKERLFFEDLEIDLHALWENNHDKIKTWC